MNFLPSRKLGAILGVLVVGAAGAGVLLLFPDTQKKTDTAPPQNETSALLKTAASRDADGDGLRDWEERLWGTDPEVRDTDGDRTTDGDEVAAGRDPRVAGPNDALKGGEIPSTVSNEGNGARETAQGTTTLTDQFARNIFGNYLAARQSGGTLTPEEEQQILRAALTGSAFQTKNTQALYTHSDIAANTGVNGDLHMYGNRVGAVIREHSFETENEMVLLKRAVEQNSAVALEKIARIIDGYHSIENTLANMPIPKDAAGAHLTLLNATADMRRAIENMHAVETDPLRALLAVQTYRDTTKNLRNALVEFKNYLEQRGISYQEGEPGALLTAINL